MRARANGLVSGVARGVGNYSTNTSPAAAGVPFSPADELSTPKRKGATNEHGENLKTDNGKVRPGPSSVRLCVLPPQFRKRPGPVCSAEHAVGDSEKVYVGG